MAIYQLRENRVWRPFLGGAKLDALAGRSEGTPGHYPERWIASTTGTASVEGYSRLTDGRLLRDVLGRDTGVLVKRRGVGMFVAVGASALLRQRRRDDFARDYLVPLLREAAHLGIGTRELTEMMEALQ